MVLPKCTHEALCVYLSSNENKNANQNNTAINYKGTKISVLSVIG